MTTRAPLVLPIVLALLASGAQGEEKKPRLVGTRKHAGMKVDLGLPTFDEMPKGQLEKPKPAAEAEVPAPRPAEGYAVVAVTHARSFVRTPAGLKPAAPLAVVAVSGRPLTSEPFSTNLRVKSAGRRSARVEVAVLDARGDAVLEASGELTFNARDASDETDWTVEWAPTSVRAAGEYRLQVRIGGDQVGSFPIKFAETPR